jgi:hypothetical protein
MEYAIIFATFFGPIMAVQAQRWVDLQRERHSRRLAIFRTLMATRGASLSSVHVEALNAIPIEFYGKKKSFIEVVSAWKEYIDYLGQDNIDLAIWHNKRYDLFIELMWMLSKSLKYEFTRLEIQKDVYSPRGHARLDEEQQVIRQGLFKIFTGESTLPLDIKSFAVDEDTLQRQKNIQEALQLLIKDGSIRIVIDNNDEQTKVTTP